MISVDFSSVRGPRKVGVVSTPHGPFRVPNFMPVATRGAIRGVLSHTLRPLGCEILLANAFHLALRPGDQWFHTQAKTLRKFMGWDGPLLTDSGGYQVLSLAKLRTVEDHGVRVRSPYDGAYHWITPERVIQCQVALGSTFIMPLDELHPPDAPSHTIRSAVETSFRWFRRAKAELQNHVHEGLLVPIFQGGCDGQFRRHHIEQLVAAHGWSPMVAIGGLGVGESKQAFTETLVETMTMIPHDRLVYLMGIGQPEDILLAVSCGVSLFDCVLPTRNGRNGQVFTFTGKFNIRNQRFRDEDTPLEATCECPICQHYSRSLIHHLFRTHEMNGPISISIHNLFFFFRFFSKIRESIQAGTFEEFSRRFLEEHQA